MNNPPHSFLSRIVDSKFFEDDFEPLEVAGNAVLAALRADEAAPDADLHRRISSSGPQSHMYYPSEDGADIRRNQETPSQSRTPATPQVVTPTPTPTPTIKHHHSVPLPPYLVNEMASTRRYSLMGLFAEANLAWLTVDEKLYIWSYETATESSDSSDREDFCSFTVPNGQCVVSVGLVRPKKGIFKDTVEWCIVVTTHEEAILCALAFESVSTEVGFGHGPKVMLLVPTRYILATDSIPLLSVGGTKDGRIFMGGSDGCLYEMMYEGFYDDSVAYSTFEENLNTFYDGDCPVAETGLRSSQGILSSGKRALSTALLGSASSRPRKCRKVNHSSSVSSYVPDFITQASSALFSIWSFHTDGGPIIRIVIDEDRSCLYTLSARGWICTFELPTAHATTGVPPPQPMLVASMDTVRTARLYLEAVSRGRMYPPSDAYSSYVGKIEFPGGGNAAQAGVGGMDGARSILKIAESQTQSKNGFRRGREPNILTPSSIHLVPKSESRHVTLVAVTAGGMRYYLSSLSPNSFRNVRADEIRWGNWGFMPGRKSTLCYVRAPPPLDETGKIQDTATPDTSESSAVTPGVNGMVAKFLSVDKGFYGNGVSVIAFDTGTRPGTSEGSAQKGGSFSFFSRSDSSDPGRQRPMIGNTIMTTTLDLANRNAMNSTTITWSSAGYQHTPSGGACETVGFPMISPGSQDSDGALLPGGRVWDIAEKSLRGDKSTVLHLAEHSETPTDGELGVGLVPPYYPPSRSSQAVAPPESDTDALIPVGSGSSRLLTAGVTAVTNLFLPSHMRFGITLQPSFPPPEGGLIGANSFGSSSRYRISLRSGAKGFSSSAAGRSSSSRVALARSDRGPHATSKFTKSARLSPWLLQPSIVPLNPLAIQHLLPSSQVIVLNSGGLHYFENDSVLSNLGKALMSTSGDVGKDARIDQFFHSYGYKEGCAMCLSLVIGCGPAASSQELSERALRAALSRADVPNLELSGTSISHDPNVENESSLFHDAHSNLVAHEHEESFGGYVFRPSSLSVGLTSLASRLLRPLWHKPVVVVTEGKSSRGPGQRFTRRSCTTPAKVELLLDDETLEALRQPLAALQSLMRDLFAPAVSVLPGVQSQKSDGMDIDGEAQSSSGEFLISRNMQYLGNLQSRGNNYTPQKLSTRELEDVAHLIEERSLHSLYRLLSRTVQLLKLLALLRRAHSMPALPEVEWGLLHGLTCAQLVLESGAQERIETLLNSLMSMDTNNPQAASAESESVANLLTNQCYLYFSPGSRLSYLGFRSGTAALQYPHASSQRVDLTNQASSYLQRAAKYWHSAPLVTGRLLHPLDKEEYEKLALRAMEHGSPLARASALLFELEDVGGVVDLCLTAAANFSGRKVRFDDSEGKLDLKSIAQPNTGMLPWEHSLYHRHKKRSVVVSSPESKRNGGTNTASPGFISGVDVTPHDAMRTCHAILFHYLVRLLDSNQLELGERMISVCAGSTDVDFLEALYKNLIRMNHVDTLLRIDTPHLERWLIGETKTAVDDNAAVDLLWRFYVVQRNDTRAGETMWNRACDLTREHSLDDRIECLTRSLNSYTAAVEGKSALVLGHSLSVPSSLRPTTTPQPSREELTRMVTDVREKLDVAILQRRVLQAITSSGQRKSVGEERMKVLECTLVSVSDLYNEYAAKYNHFDICLLIMASCKHYDQSIIVSLWRSIICSEIRSFVSRSRAAYEFLQALIEGSLVQEPVTFVESDGDDTPGVSLFEAGDWVPRLTRKVSSLGRELFGKDADYTFPLDFLVPILEGLRQTLDIASGKSTENKSWPLQILIDVGVPFPLILTTYESLVLEEERQFVGGAGATNRAQQMSVICEVLVSWVMAATSGAGPTGTTSNPAYVQLRNAVLGDELLSKIARNKTSLEGLVSEGESTIRKVLQEYTDVESAIRRLV